MKFWIIFRDGLANGFGWSLAVLTMLWLCRWIAPIDWIAGVVTAIRNGLCG